MTFDATVMTRLAAIEAKQDKILKILLAQTGGEVADDRDLDSQYGDPEVRFELRDNEWQGPSMAGRRLSQCPVEWLDARAASDASYADYLRSDKRGSAEDIKKAGYKDKDAARARGWARRLRNGWRASGVQAPRGAPTTTRTAPSASAQMPGATRGYGGGQAGYGATGGYGHENQEAVPPLATGYADDHAMVGQTGAVDDELPFIFIETRWGRV